jgi:hypothetical protein
VLPRSGLGAYLAFTQRMLAKALSGISASAGDGGGEATEAVGLFSDEEFWLEELFLIESRLDREGARYIDVAGFSLACEGENPREAGG